MNHHSIPWFYLTIFIQFCECGHSKVGSVIDNVNAFIGTSYHTKQNWDVHDYGNCNIQIGPPFAHTPWTPQTRNNENKCTSPYYYFDNYWQGMRRTHWMSGSCTIDYGSATIIPSITTSLHTALSFHEMNHSNEVATPSYYRMNLQESGLIVETTSDVRSGIMRVTPSTKILQNGIDESEYFYLLITATDTMYNQSFIEIIPYPSFLNRNATKISNNTSANRMSETRSIESDIRVVVDTIQITNPVHRWYQSKGESARFSGYHYFKTSLPAIEYGIITNNQNVHKNVLFGNSDSFGPVTAYLKFRRRDGVVSIATGSSFLSIDKARENMMYELCENKNITQIPSNKHDYTCDMKDYNNSSTGDWNNNDTTSQLNESDTDTTDCSTLFNFEVLKDRITTIWEKSLSIVSVTPHKESFPTHNHTTTNNGPIPTPISSSTLNYSNYIDD